MANGLLRSYNLDVKCQKDSVMVVAIDDHKFWASRGPFVPLVGPDFTQIFDAQVIKQNVPKFFRV